MVFFVVVVAHCWFDLFHRNEILQIAERHYLTHLFDICYNKFIQIGFPKVAAFGAFQTQRHTVRSEKIEFDFSLSLFCLYHILKMHFKWMDQIQIEIRHLSAGIHSWLYLLTLFKWEILRCTSRIWSMVIRSKGCLSDKSENWVWKFEEKNTTCKSKMVKS